MTMYILDLVVRNALRQHKAVWRIDRNFNPFVFLAMTLLRKFLIDCVVPWRREQLAQYYN